MTPIRGHTPHDPITAVPGKAVSVYISSHSLLCFESARQLGNIGIHIPRCRMTWQVPGIFPAHLSCCAVDTVLLIVVTYCKHVQ